MRTCPLNKACRPLRCSAAALLLALWAGGATAQLQINSSPSPVGSGARALGMGSAFIAVADDATAASWNPAGLTQLQDPEFSFVYDFRRVRESFNSRFDPRLAGDYEVELGNFNFASITYPLPLTIAGRNAVVSLAVQRQFSFDRDLDYGVRQREFTSLLPGTSAPILFLGFPGPIRDTLIEGEYSQRGSLSTFTPSFAIELTNNLSVGVAVNIWDESLVGSNGWKTRQSGSSTTTIGNDLLRSGVVSLFSQQEEFEDFRGTNLTLGLLWRPTERWSIGMRYDSELSADVAYTRTGVAIANGRGLAFTRTTSDREYTFPAAIGVGTAYRFPGDKLTLSLDVTYRDWDDFVIIEDNVHQASLTIPGAFSRSFSGLSQRLSPLTNGPKGAVPVDPTWTVRLGAEYVFVDESRPKQDYLPSLRAGIFYDPEPASGRDNVLINGQTQGLEQVGDGEPDDFYGVSVGAGLLIKNRINLDVAYEYRWGDDVRTDTFGFFDTNADVDQHSFYFSTVFYF